MKKNTFFKMSLILVMGGFITKLLGMVIRIVMTRYIKTEGMGIYMLIMPTYSLLITVSQLGFPVAISKLVSEEKYDNKNIVLSIIPFSLLINLTLMFLMFIFARYISINLLHEPRTYYGLLAIGLVLPFISISSILRGYFFGKSRMIPHVISNIIEDIIRLTLIILVVPHIKRIEQVIFFLFFISFFSELSSIIIFLVLAPNKMDIRKTNFKKQDFYFKKIMDISLPTTGSRLIGNIGYFLEPIIITFVLSKFYSNHFIVSEYGIINGYVMPLLFLPSFFTLAISQALIPIISKKWASNDKESCIKKIKQSIIYSLSIGIPCTLCFFLFPSFPLNFMYKTSIGSNYLRILSIPFLFYYIQVPLTAAMQAMDMAKKAMKGTLFGMVFRTFILFIFSYFKIGLYSLVIATSFNILFVTLHQYKHIKRKLEN